MNAAQFLGSTLPIRLSFGLAGLVKPAWLCKACGMHEEDVTEETRFLMRAFATRDLVLGLQHLNAVRQGEDAAKAALGGAAVIGAMDGVSIVADIASRGQVRGGARVAAMFAVSDGIGLPLAHAFFTRSRRG